MAILIDYQDFNTFANNLINSNIEDTSIDSIKELFDSYTTYMVTKKMPQNDIKHNRMNSIINYYEYYKNQNYDKNNLIEYYNKNVKDDFNKILNPPKCLFTAAQRERRIEKEKEEFEKETDDIAHHYKEINDKYLYYYNESQRNYEDEEISEYEYEDNDDNNEGYYTSDSEYYYDEYYSEYDSDYLSDDY